ncbi:helix-turn-helix domain-containing protein [Fusobacterium ulcerans]|uniref:helix-turn-helix domain-containing protein n=1 Tax=Fusobacterium ulcerans TaxID=861 RepID=UPI0026EEC30F|nr:helix-turn-helix transcriptional regulator [Fusobacterium ulcerans]
MTIYDRIKERREKLGLTQEELAKELGYISRSSIAKIESGKVDIPQSKILSFAKALKTTPSYIMGWVEENEQINLLSKKDKLQYDTFMSEAALFFNDEKISDEDKDKLYKIMTELYFDSKEKNREKRKNKRNR